MVDPVKLIEAAKLLIAHSVKLVFQMDHTLAGHVWLDPEDVVLLATDREEFLARMYGVTKPQMQRYLVRRDEEWQCTALARTTRKRCQIRWSSYLSLDPKEYDPERHDHCPIHRDLDGVREAEEA